MKVFCENENVMEEIKPFVLHGDKVIRQNQPSKEQILETVYVCLGKPVRNFTEKTHAAIEQIWEETDYYCIPYSLRSEYIIDSIEPYIKINDSSLDVDWETGEDSE